MSVSANITICVDYLHDKATNTPSLLPTTSTGADPIPVDFWHIATSTPRLLPTISTGVDPITVRVQAVATGTEAMPERMDAATLPTKNPESTPHQGQNATKCAKKTEKRGQLNNICKGDDVDFENDDEPIVNSVNMNMNDVGNVHNVNEVNVDDKSEDLSVNTGEIVKCTNACVIIMSPSPLIYSTLTNSVTLPPPKPTPKTMGDFKFCTGNKTKCSHKYNARPNNQNTNKPQNIYKQKKNHLTLTITASCQATKKLISPHRFPPYRNKWIYS